MGAWALLLLPPLLMAVARAQVCSVNRTVFEVKENTRPSGPLVDIHVPKGQEVTLGPLSTLFAFRIEGTKLFLNVTPDYEENTVLTAQLECRIGDTVVTKLMVLVTVLDVNDNPPVFPFEVKVKRVPEDTKVNATVIPETELQAKDLDQSDILFYTLREVTLGASSFFSLVGANRPALRLDRPLDFDGCQNMSFQLLVRDTRDEDAVPSHTATATLVLEVQPADLRPPWFLPCVYADAHVCVQAQYRGAVPTGHQLPGPLILRPGPIYAVDGDRGINQRIIYSILSGHGDGTFVIDAASGNLTMTRSVPSPKTFLLLVKGEQEDHARYSVTQVSVEARNALGSPPRFPESLYRGTVALGSGIGVPVMDAADPSQPLRIRAQDPEFPDLNSAIVYRITNNSEFRMHGEVVLTAAQLVRAGVFYAEVEANNTVTSGTAATVLEIHVSQQEPSPPGPPGSPPPTDAGRTTQPSSSSTSEAPTPSTPPQGPSTPSSAGSTGPQPPSSSPTSKAPTPSTPPQGPSTPPQGPSTPPQGPSTPSSAGSTGPQPPSSSPTSKAPTPSTPPQGPSTPPQGPSTPPQGPSTPSSAGSTGLYPSSGTTLRPSASPTPAGPSSAGTSTAPSSGSSSGGATLTPQPGSPGTGTGGSTGSRLEDRRFSAGEMGTVGGVLGVLLLLALLALAILVHKHYSAQLGCCSGKAPEAQPCGFDNKAFLPDDHPENWAPAPSPSHGRTPAEGAPAPQVPTPPRSPVPAQPASPAPVTPSRVPESPAAVRDQGGPAAVRSILTKERRPEGGYKAVWFGETIGAEADVVVLNAPTSDADGAGDSGSEGSDDQGAGAGPDRGPDDEAPSTDSTYI